MKYLISTALCASLFFSQPSSANKRDEELVKLKSDLLALVARVEALEAQNNELRASAEAIVQQSAELSEASKKSSWADKISLKGDFRYRYENIDVENADNRERNRFRARAAIVAKPANNLEVGIGVASGDDDPLSTNQTLGGGSSTKDLRLDLAYFKWQFKPGATLQAGKIKNIWYKPGGIGLLWDGDFRPEGVALTLERNSYFLNTGFNFLESDTKKGNSLISYGIQAGYGTKIADGEIVFGASYYDIGAKNREVFYGDNDDFLGNTFTCADLTTLSGCEYRHDYEEVELFAQLNTQLRGRPLMLSADYVQNQDTEELDTAWAAGIKLGKASAPRTWELAWIYQDIEADSVFGLTTDSDFGGGGTDSTGHIFRGGWAINKKWKISFTYFLNEKNVDLGVKEDYDRIQIDSAFKF